MTRFNEQALEIAIMELFQNEGYDYVNGEEIHKDISDVLLYDDLRLYFMSRYKAEGITELEVAGIIARLSANVGQGVYENNVETYRLITDGFLIGREDASMPRLFVEPIDFENEENNVFKIVSQLEIKGAEKRIPDAIVYINGLPMVVLEFKSAVKENTTIRDAYTQLTVRYKRDIPDLFKYNAFVVISDGVNSKYGSMYSQYDFFYSWRKVERDDKDAEGINSLFTMVKGLFRKDRLLRVIKDFVFMPDASKDDTKIVCLYPQFFAVTELFENIKRHSRLTQGGDGKGGTYFGATGCGKSYTMLFLTRLLMRSKFFCSPTIILITDRTDLDNQLSKKFLEAKKFIGDSAVHAVSSRSKLSKYLENKSSGGVFLTTIQKFTEDTKLLSDRANVICISDEAHRSQTNMLLNVKQTEEGIKRSYGFAKYLHDSFPNATYVGFTGTPIDATLEVFGGVVDAYTMAESVADGITRRIVYEGRRAKVLLDNEKLEEIEQFYKLCIEEGANEYQVEESKKAMARMERIIGDTDRLQAVAKDFIAHYENRVAEGSTVLGKAMFVCSNRAIAYELYKMIVAMRPQWAEKRLCDEGVTLTHEEEKEIKPMERIKLVMTRNKDDEKELYDMLGTDEERKKLDKQFKNTKSNFKIAIVVDMWITGFDVPCLDTMYIDKLLQRHTLVQTISRVNRVFEGKDKGLVVDYIGIDDNMQAALKQYAGGEINGTSLEMIDQSISVVKDELDILRRMFVKFDYRKFTNGTPLEQLECLNKGAEFMQATKEQESDFMGHAKKLKSAYGLCSSSEEITYEEREDIHYFSGVRSIIYKLTVGEVPDASRMNRKVSMMVEEAIKAEGVQDIFEIDNKKGNIDVMSEEYMKRLEKLKLPNTKVKLMERLLKKVITEFKKVNKMQGVDFSKRLNELVVRYNDRSDKNVLADEVLTEVASRMADLLKEINIERRSFEKLGITYEEKAFYDILKSIARQFNFEYAEDKLLMLAGEVKKIVDDKSKYTDWSKRDDIKAELKMDLILILAQYEYPPVDNDGVFKEIFEQAENFKKYND